jgi:molecular chaperone GrpE (heat shock protein)
MQKGYSLHGRVIRPAMVMVSKGPSAGIDEKV